MGPRAGLQEYNSCTGSEWNQVYSANNMTPASTIPETSVKNVISISWVVNHV